LSLCHIERKGGGRIEEKKRAIGGKKKEVWIGGCSKTSAMTGEIYKGIEKKKKGNRKKFKNSHDGQMGKLMQRGASAGVGGLSSRRKGK